MTEPDPQLVERVDRALRCWHVLALGVAYEEITVQPIRELAEVVVKDLAESGRLLPPDLKAREEWRVTCVGKMGQRVTWYSPVTKKLARQGLADCIAEAVWPDPRIESRTVRELSDGSTLVGPWKEVE